MLSTMNKPIGATPIAFPIEQDIRYKLLNKRTGEESGDGKTVNISSNGILFTSQHVLLPGRRLEVAVSWPAQPHSLTNAP